MSQEEEEGALASVACCNFTFMHALVGTHFCRSHDSLTKVQLRTLSSLDLSALFIPHNFSSFKTLTPFPSFSYYLNYGHASQTRSYFVYRWQGLHYGPVPDQTHA